MHSFVLSTVRIPLSAVRKGQTDFSIAVEMEVPYTDERVTCRQIMINARITRMGEDLLIKLGLSADGLFNCDRCGEPFQRPIRGEITTLFTSDSLKLEGTEGGEIRLLDTHATVLDLTGSHRCILPVHS